MKVELDRRWRKPTAMEKIKGGELMGMKVELDHVFIGTARGAPEADRLVEFGLVEGSRNRHPGQGTACRRFFFRNAMLELVWVEDAEEALGALGRPLMLLERCSGAGDGVSPFGVCVRPVAGGAAVVPFPAWAYRPAYLPEPLEIHVALGSPVEEPLWFYLGFGERPDPGRQPLEHPAGLLEVTGVRLITPVLVQSEAMAEMVRAGVVVVRRGPEHVMELTFDSGRQGRSRDFQPGLPLVVRW